MADEVEEVEADVAAPDLMDVDEALQVDAAAEADLDDDDEDDPEAPPDDADDDINADVDEDEEASGEDDDQVDEDGDHEAADGDPEDEEEEDDAEAVGAVKLKPGETDEDSDNDSDSSASTFSDRESTAEWHDAPENDEEEEEEGDEESETGAPTWKEPRFRPNDDDEDEEEESDFSEADDVDENVDADVEMDADEDDEDHSDQNSEAGLPRAHVDAEGVDAGMSGTNEHDDPVSPTSARRASAGQIARDLLPPQRFANKPDSHSMFNQLVLDEDPMDGSRVLRKRKTSSAEAEERPEPEPDQGLQLRKRKKQTSEESTGDATHEESQDADTVTQPRSVRSLRLKFATTSTPCCIWKRSRNSLQIKIRVDPSSLSQILSRRPKPLKKRGRAVAARTPATREKATDTQAAIEAALPTPFFSSGYSQPFYSFYDRETDETKGKPYGGILSEEQADTTKTLPTKEDRRRFDEAKQKAEGEWRDRLLAMQAEPDISPVRKSKKDAGPTTQIQKIVFAGWEIQTWYAAPYPEEYSRNKFLFICEFCLKYMSSEYVASRHKLKCPAKHPPGDEIYRHGSISFFEVDGRKNPVYCQNLCLLAKLFLGSKTLYYDVEPFLFYVLCEYDEFGYHFVGYFSKEKRASSQNNVSCILTMPIHQRKGYGHLLIDFSYLLTRVEEKCGSPEKPLSDMGLVSYRSYWRLKLCKYLTEYVPEDKAEKKGLSIRQISDDTGMTPDDVVSALEALRFLVRDPITHTYAFRIDLPYCHKELERFAGKKYVHLNPEALSWTPYVMGQGNATNFELGPALNTIAPREEEEDEKHVEVLVETATEAIVPFPVVEEEPTQPNVDSEAAVLESTEPNDNTLTAEMVDAKPSNADQENISQNSSDPGPVQNTVDGPTETFSPENSWQRQYDNIPISRFQVFPPISKRPGMPRSMSSMVRPSLLAGGSSAVRTPASGRPRARPRRPAGSSSARKASAKKTSSAKRKTGGTGRGPGRWPKGTKKSDYGNAASGPGLPPAWRQKQLTSIAVTTDAEEDNEMHDTVQVHVNETKGKGGKEVETISAVFAVKNDSSSSSGASFQSHASIPHGAKTNGVGGSSAGDEGVDMAVAVAGGEDVDAPGEEE